MNFLLPNMRLLGLESSVGGRDFLELTQEIDQALEKLGHDLAEESVYFFFTQFPEDCRVARSVIGPARASEDLLMWDWVASPVQKMSLKARAWSAVIPEVEKLLETSARDSQKVILRLGRRVEKGQLSLNVEAFVHG